MGVVIHFVKTHWAELTFRVLLSGFSLETR